MEIAIIIVTVFIALLHCYFLWLEMFGWLTRAPKVFNKIPKETFIITKDLAANQGLYNGFLAAGLLWSIFISDSVWHHNVALFFASCVAVAGIYGALSVDRKIFFIQALPALLLMILLMLQMFWL